ncbi:transcriptional regulatory protein AlgP-like [Armigeres subalbatus]|uniref:transcriptional regulatory protein AlgP-like n=1 Tax=Armigeres subalbatus TaxID=124917 RepID=UPI002ECFF279
MKKKRRRLLPIKLHALQSIEENYDERQREHIVGALEGSSRTEPSRPISKKQQPASQPDRSSFNERYCTGKPAESEQQTANQPNGAHPAQQSVSQPNRSSSRQASRIVAHSTSSRQASRIEAAAGKPAERGASSPAVGKPAESKQQPASQPDRSSFHEQPASQRIEAAAGKPAERGASSPAVGKPAESKQQSVVSLPNGAHPAQQSASQPNQSSSVEPFRPISKKQQPASQPDLDVKQPANRGASNQAVGKPAEPRFIRRAIPTQQQEAAAGIRIVAHSSSATAVSF